MPEKNTSRKPEPEQQEKLYLKALEKNPGSIKTHHQLAVFLSGQNRCREAIRVLDRCIENNPGNVRSYFIRANSRFKVGHTSKAAKDAMQALELAPKSIKAFLFAVHMQLGDLQALKAQELLDKILDLNPNLQQLKRMKALQARILHMRRQAEHEPAKWLARRLNWRLKNAAAEDE
jgi:tetratricopeptide (TPR) repeat protein